jgi:acyl dehydratase
LIDSVRGDDMKIVALLLRDSNPIHFDVGAVARAGLGNRLVNQGGATMAYVIDYVVGWAGSRSALRSITCFFRGNVVAGDDVEIGATVTTVQPADDGLLVDLDVRADVVGGRTALTGTARVLWRETKCRLPAGWTERDCTPSSGLAFGASGSS